MTSLKSQLVGDGYDHLIAHALSCTLESSVRCEMEDGEITFGSLNKVIKGVHLRYLDEGKGARGIFHCALNEARHKEEEHERGTRCMKAVGAQEESLVRACYELVQACAARPKCGVFL